MRLSPLVLALGLLAAPASAQDTPQKMLDMARQVRAQAEQLRAHLSPEDYADMLAQAAQIEQDVRDGGFSAPVAREPVTLSKRIADAHQGRLDWLDGEAACVGYGWENHRTFVSNYGDPERDRLCRKAFAHFETYFRITRDGAGAGEPHLAAYDEAARAAVDYYAARRR
ncbi:hypothetical protein [Phenylobacterium sp.]|uniref:hypothetical protein n=1 Tax=Phenylobacterium sp. TaxID=1871053 RepID=UPI0025FD1053|nr:hypothetical protein [Phenylobacterium sp.]MBX3485392.1 hypothetical protein [Phenylobacterium sp.]